MKVKNKNLLKPFLTKTTILRFLVAALSLVGLVIVTMMILELKAEADDIANVYPPGQLISLDDGRKMHLHCTGSGSPTVLLEAGMGGSSLDWKVIQQKVSSNTKVCSYDRLGYAWSDEANSTRSIDNEEKELHELLQKARIDPPYVIAGHSLGGYIARLFAARHDDQVDGLVLVDPPYEADRENDANPPAYTDPLVNVNLYITIIKSNLGLVRSDYLSNYSDSDSRTEEQVALLSSSKNFRTMQSEYSELSNSSLYIQNNAKSVGSIPTTYIVTSHRIAQSREFCAISKICTVQSSGDNDHLIPQNNPNIVILAIDDLMLESSQ